MKSYSTRGRSALRGAAVTASVVVSALAVAACGSSSSKSAAASATATPAASTTAATNSSGSFSLTVGYIGTAGVFTGPEGFAYSKGLLQKWLAPAGVSSIKSAQFANGPLLTEALVGGSVGLGILGDTPALIGKSQGAPTRMINQDEVGLSAWIVTKKGITSLSQLAGKPVAVQQGSYMDRYLQGLLSEQGLTSKIHPVAMLDAQSVPALEAGSLDAVVMPSEQALAVVSKGFTTVAKSETTPSLQGTEVTEEANSVLSAHPALAAAWNAARDKAIAYAKAHASAYYAYQGKAEGVPSAAQAAVYLPLSEYPSADFTTSGIQHLQGTLNFLVSAKEAKSFSIQSWEDTGS
jgi:sulfonate transport system substrate-binding protein